LSIVFSIQSYSQIQWEVFDLNNSPLQNNTIRCIAPDHTGGIWIGTDHGAFHYNMGNWSVYDTSNSNIPSNNIRAIFVDDTANVWMGTFNSGLVLFSNNFWTQWSTSNSDIPNDFIKHIIVDDSSRLFLATSYGLVQKQSNNVWRSWDVFNSNLWSSNISGLSFLDGSIYTGSFNGGMNVLTDTIITPYNSYTSSFTDNTVLQVDDYSGSMWCATASSGVIRYTPPSSISVFSTLNSSIPTNSLTAVFCSNKVYLGSYDEGLIVYNSIGGFLNYNLTNSPMPDNFVTCITEEGDDLWVGTQNGGLVRIVNFTPVTPINSSEKIIMNYNNQALGFNRPVSGKINVFNTEGKLIYTQSIKSKQIISLPNLSRGIYLVSLHNNTTHFSSKFTVN